MMNEEEIAKECEYIRNTLQDFAAGKRVFERSLSIGLSVMPVVGKPALWIYIRDSQMQIFINENHLAIGKGKPNEAELIANNGASEHFFIMNHTCIRGEDDMFSYTLMYPTRGITLEALKVLKSTAEFAQDFVKVPVSEIKVKPELRGTIFHPSFML